MTELTELPDLRDAFESLRRGRHVCSEDGALYASLQEHQRDFEKLFAALGFKLVFHPRGFYYFQGEAALSGETRKIAVFFFILVEFLADRGEYVEEALLSGEFEAAELPHLSSDRYRDLMKEVEITSADDLGDTVRRMETLGFVRRLGDGRFRLKTPAHRLIDLCRTLRDAPPAQSEALFNEPPRNAPSDES